jgi:tetratricopeptide (TPR) repeat protein
LPDFSRIANAEYARTLLYEKGNEFYSKGFLQKTFDLYECAEKIFQELFDKGQTDLENHLAPAKVGKSVALYSQGKLDEAITIYDEAIKIRERLVNELKQDHFANNLAGAYLNKGSALYSQGKSDEAIANYDKAIKIRERLVNELKQDHLANKLAMTYWGKGVVLRNQGKLNEAIESYDKAIKIYERLVNKLKRDQFANDLAAVYMNKGSALYSQGKSDEAITIYDEAIKIRERLVNELKQDHFANNLALVYMNKGNSLYSQDKLNEAIESYDKSEKTRDCWLERGHYQVLPDFVKNIRNRVRTLLKLKDWRRAAGDVVAAFDFAGRWRGVELSEYFIKQIKEHRDVIISQLRKVSAKNRKEIYKHAGEFGGAIKELVEDFEKDEKKS